MITIKIYGTDTQLTLAGTQADLTSAQSADSAPYTLDCLALDPQLNLKGDATETAGGYLQNPRGYRYGLTVRSYPYDFGLSDWGNSSTGIVGLISKLNSNFLYIQFYDYGQNSIFVSNAATKVLAVSILSIDTEHDHEHGRKFVTINFESYKVL
jgi:hypothetical protein